MSSWVPLGCSPDLWSQGTIPQPKYHPPEKERRNCVLLRGCSLQCRREGIEAPPSAIAVVRHLEFLQSPFWDVLLWDLPTSPELLQLRTFQGDSWSSGGYQLPHGSRCLENGISPMLKMSCSPNLWWPKVQTVVWDESFWKSCLGRMHWNFVVVSFMSLLSLGFAKTVSQTAASLVLQGFGGASHATREFGDALYFRGTLARGGVPGFYHSFNSFE